MNRRLLVIALGTALVVQPLGFAMPGTAAVVEAAQAAQGLVKLSEEMITSGAKLVHYTWNKSNGSYSNVHVIEVDLTNPYVKLDVMNGKQGSVTGLGSVGSMVKNSGAVAGVNADFFNTAGKGSTLGGQVTSGELVASPSQLQGMYAFSIDSKRKPFIDLFDFKGTVTAANGQQFPLDGINKAAYQKEPGGPSHANAIYLYTSEWTVARPSAAESGTTPTEVLVVDGIVQQIVENGTIQTAIPKNGYILRTHGKAANFVTANIEVGQMIDTDYSLVARSTQQAYAPSELEMFVGGHTILVDEGKNAAFSRDTQGISGSAQRSRTAIGYTQDRGKVLLITVEAVGNSKGMTLTELQQMMVKLGVWKGMNLDGGGSTTMISRPLGEFDTGLAHPTENGSQRGVANGVGVFTTAPAGQLQGIKVSGASTLFVGQQATYSIKGYDSYYNPVDPGNIAPNWTAEGGIGKFNGNVFTAAKSGKANIAVKSGAAGDKLAVEVIGGDQIAQMSAAPSSPVLEAGKTITLAVKATLKDGRTLTVPAESVEWEFVGFKGSVKDGALTIAELSPGAKVGYVIARYDGFSTTAVLAGGADKKFEDFEKSTYPITFSGTNNITGTVKLESGLGGRNESKALRLDYDLSAGSGTKAAYAVFNGNGVKIEGQPSAISLDVLGDNSVNWLRAEFVDSKGSTHLVTLADKINWSGWKEIKAALPADKIAYPISLKRIYVVSIEEGQDERALKGSIALDNIHFQYAALAPETARQKITLQLGSKKAVVGGKEYQLDVAPFALKGTTYLPLRFVTETMGAQVEWKQKLKRVTVLRDNKFMEMWLDQKQFILNGVRKEAAVAPISRNGRTLVPIRLVSEQLGLTVKWEKNTNTVIVE